MWAKSPMRWAKRKRSTKAKTVPRASPQSPGSAPSVSARVSSRQSPVSGRSSKKSLSSAISGMSSASSSRTYSAHSDGTRRGQALANAPAAVVDGMTVGDFKRAIIDVCSQTITVIDEDGYHISVLRRILRAEKIKYRSLPKDHPMVQNTIRFFSPVEFQRFLCKSGWRPR